MYTYKNAKYKTSLSKVQYTSGSRSHNGKVITLECVAEDCSEGSGLAQHYFPYSLHDNHQRLLLQVV